jgi:hypothetical protein
MQWPADPNAHRDQAALAWTCDICKAAVKNLCTNTIHIESALPGRVIHIGRLIDRRRE